MYGGQGSRYMQMNLQYTRTVYGDQSTQQFISKGDWLYTETVYGASMQDIFRALDKYVLQYIEKGSKHDGHVNVLYVIRKSFDYIHFNT